MATADLERKESAVLIKAGDTDRSTNGLVSPLQRALNAAGATDNSGSLLTVDGVFGPKTAEAVVKYSSTWGHTQSYIDDSLATALGLQSSAFATPAPTKTSGGSTAVVPAGQNTIRPAVQLPTSTGSIINWLKANWMIAAGVAVGGFALLLLLKPSGKRKRK